MEWSIGLLDCRKVVVGFDMNSHWQTSIVPDCNTLLSNISNQWHHTAFVYDGTNYNLYVDGVLDINTHGPCGFLSANIGNFLLGKDYTGDLDDILIYKRALTSAEVTQLYGLGSSCCPYTATITSKIGKLDIFPNPSTNIVYIKTDETIRHVSLYDLSGRIIITQNSNSYYINVSNIPKSIYILEVKTENGIYTKKLIKN